LALYNDFRTKEYDPNSQVVPDGQTARRSRPLATGARLFDQVRGLQTIQGRSLLDSLQQAVFTIQSGLEHLIDPDYVVGTGINSNVAALQDSTRHYASARESYRRPSFEGQGYSHPMEGFSLTTTIHDSG
jgi:hypothetical protein